MTLRFLTLSKLRSAFALVLVLWCAGTGCLAHRMGMGGSTERVVGKNTSMSGHACCKARHRALRNVLTPGSDADTSRLTFTLPEESDPSNANSCCPLTSGSFVTVSRGQTFANDSSELILAATQKHTGVTLLTERAPQLPLTGGEHTYLEGCALLI